MSHRAPKPAYANIAAVIDAYDATDVLAGDVVYVADIGSFVVVLKPVQLAQPIFLRPTYPTLEDFEADAVAQGFPAFTPGYIANVGAYIYDPCGSLTLSEAMLPAASNTTGIIIPLDRDPDVESGMTTNYSASALPTVDDVP